MVFLALVPNQEKNISSAVWFLVTKNYQLSFTTPENYQEPILATWADVDRDGAQDAIVYLKKKRAIRFIIGNEQSPQAPRIIEAKLAIRPPISLGVRDLNGDGLVDILAADSSYITIRWQDKPSAPEQLSFSQFTSFYTLLSTERNPLASSKLLFGDYNGDGREDFVVFGYLYLNQGSGKFNQMQIPVLINNTLNPVRVADFDGDGKTELLFIRLGKYQNSVDELVVAGFDQQKVFKEKFSISTGFFRISEYSFGDFNGDNYADLAFFSQPDNILTMLRGSAKGFSTGKPDTLLWESGLGGMQLLGPMDWGRDGIIDWLFRDSQTGLLSVKYNKGLYYLDKSADVGLNKTMSGHAAAVGDYNNDGYPDIYIVNGSGSNSLFAGRSGGTFRDLAEQAGVALANDGISCAWGDYDSDGFADLFVAGLSLPDKLFRNSGNGTFADSSHILGLNRGGQRATSVSWGDVNRDGWLDLLIGNYDGPNWLLINRSGRSFQDRSKDMGLVEADNTESAVFVDVNGDGWLDIFALNPERPNRLLMGSQKGVFLDSTAASGLNPPGEAKKFGQTQTWGDFNGDGLPDLYITRAQDIDMLFINQGSSASNSQRFSLKFSDYIQGRYGRIASAIADFSDDGRPDLLIARCSAFGIFYTTPSDLLFYGGTGGYPVIAENVMQFSTNLGLRQNYDSSLPVPVDFDLDRDLDVLFVNYLVDNSSDLFHGSSLPLRYMQNQTFLSRTILVKPRRLSKKSLIGTRVIAAYSGKTYLQTVSGGYGRIQTGQNLLFSLGDAASADSLVVYWPQGRKLVYNGPFYPGTVEVVEDDRSPSLKALKLPGEAAQPVIAGADSLDALIEVNDDSPLKWLRSVLLYRKSSKADTLYYPFAASGVFKLKIPLPGPGDSLYYYFEAEDIHGNRTRLPSSLSQLYLLSTKSDIFLGDINYDRVINLFDIVRLIQIISGQGNPPTGNELIAADVNRDGLIDMLDFMNLLNKMNTRY
ncbi:MAG TPA: FG-GAP-like repeat-containing protein [archaeon]|nr:FG-GAP-like repeat-containing protein [archaeon]